MRRGSFAYAHERGVVHRGHSALSGRYAIEREIGAGGMATVFLARNIKHNRRFALKVIRPELAAIPGTERFLSEIEVTANLQHPTASTGPQGGRDRISLRSR